MSPTINHKRGSKHSDFQYDNKTLEVKKVLGLILDNKMKFDKHIVNICQKASRKLNTFARLTNYMESPKRRIQLLPNCLDVSH